MKHLEFYKFAWSNSADSTSLPMDDTLENTYYCTQWTRQGSEFFDYGMDMYLIGIDRENGQTKSYKAELRFDWSQVDFDTAGEYVCAGTVVPVVEGLTIPFEVPAVVCRLTVE